MVIQEDKEYLAGLGKRFDLRALNRLTLKTVQKSRNYKPLSYNLRLKNFFALSVVISIISSKETLLI